MERAHCCLRIISQNDQHQNIPVKLLDFKGGDNSFEHFDFITYKGEKIRSSSVVDSNTLSLKKID